MTSKTTIDIVGKSNIPAWCKPHFRTCLLAWLILFSSMTTTSYSQLKVFPAPSPSKQSGLKQKSTKLSSARTQELVPRSLPFWDDFSTTRIDINGDTLSSYPLDSLWVKSKAVAINSGLAIHPPSVNVATFDGLNSSYIPYSYQALFNGFRDTLTSQPIKLNEVDPTERNSVYLSFFYQWDGNGEPPDTKDYMRVEFKNDEGIWEPVMTIQTLTTSTSDKFYDTLVKVDGDRFFHDAFQFRFKNYGRLSGPYDTWNIDYIYLNKNRSETDRYLPDRTITSSLSNLFNGYRSIPYHHFLIDKLISQPKFDVFNIKNDTSTLSYQTEGTFINYKDSVGAKTVIDPLGNAGTTPIDGATGIIFQRQRKTVTMQHVPDGTDATQFDPDADSVAVSLKVRLFTGDTFNPITGAFANDYNPAVYKPLDFRSNDTIRSNYILRDYYAYDDGSGEYSVGLTTYGNRAAYLFEMLTPDPDTLIAFDIYFPDYGITNNLSVDFTIYNDDGGLPGSVVVTIPSVTVKQNGHNKFQRVQFIGQSFLVQNKFYIGWKAPVGGILKVGLDTNNDSGDKLYINTNGTWIQNTDVVGSVMIRPVFGKGDIVLGIEDKSLQRQIYPNPNQGEFFIPKSFQLLYVRSVTGQLLPFTTEEYGDKQKVLLPNAAPGLYILRLQKNDKQFSSKIIVR